jgi:hypothetical protein
VELKIIPACLVFRLKPTNHISRDEVLAFLVTFPPQNIHLVVAFELSVIM